MKGASWLIVEIEIFYMELIVFLFPLFLEGFTGANFILLGSLPDE